MIDDLVSLKAATIERCVSRAHEGYGRSPNTFAADLPARDADIFNILRPPQGKLDAGQHLIYHECHSAHKVLMIVPTLLAAPVAGRGGS